MLKKILLIVLFPMCLFTLIDCSQSIKRLSPEEFIELGKRAADSSHVITIEFIGYSHKYSYIEYLHLNEEPRIFYIKTDRLPEGFRRQICGGINPFPSWNED